MTSSNDYSVPLEGWEKFPDASTEQQNGGVMFSAPTDLGEEAAESLWVNAPDLKTESKHSVLLRKIKTKC